MQGGFLPARRRTTTSTWCSTRLTESSGSPTTPWRLPWAPSGLRSRTCGYRAPFRGAGSRWRRCCSKDGRARSDSSFGCRRWRRARPRRRRAGRSAGERTNPQRVHAENVTRNQPMPGEISMRFARLLALAVLLPAAARGAGAQGRSMTPIPQNAYDDWKTIASPLLSNDGKWVAYTLTPEVGEGTLVVRSTSGSTEYRQGRGFLARPNLTPSGGRGGFTATAPAITADSRWVIFTIEPSRDAVEKARREKRR